MRRQHHAEAVQRKTSLGGKVLLEGGLLEQEKVKTGASIKNRF